MATNRITKKYPSKHVLLKSDVPYDENSPEGTTGIVYEIDGIIKAKMFEGPGSGNQDNSAILQLLDNKVDKVPGLGLSEENFSSADKAKLDNVDYLISNKVDKVPGLGLSEENFSSADKAKLDSIASGAQVNVGTDLSVTSITATGLTIASSTGADASLPAASITQSGLMSADDKVRVLGIETEISKSMPAGTLGQVPFIKTEGTREAQPDFIVRTGKFVITDQEKTDAAQTVVTNETIFNTWYRYSHNNTETQPAIPAELSSWSYDSNADIISGTINSSSNIGFVSTKRYTSYSHQVKVWSTNSDDDDIGVLLAFDKDPVTGREYTLTAIRSPGGTSIGTWSIWYNYLRSDSYMVADGTSAIAWGNGGFGETRAISGYVTNSSGNGWVSASRSTIISIVRDGDVFTAKTSQLGSDLLVESSALTVNLTSDARLMRFRGPKPYGYMAFSQAACSFQVISFSDIANVIYDLRDGSALVYNQSLSSWMVTPGKTVFADFGYGRLLHNPDTKRTFFTNRDDTVLEIVAPSASGTSNAGFVIPQNPVGQTYGNGVSALPPYRIEQTVGDSDAWRIYGESPVSNTVSMVFEVADDIELAGSEWIFRNKRGFDDGVSLPFQAIDAFRITGAGDAYAGGNLVLHTGNIGSYAIPLTGGTLDGNLTVTGSLTATVYNTSSERYKVGIIGLQSSTIESLMMIEPKYYYHNLTGRYEYGLIAEEVNKYFPEIVQLDDEGIPHALDYSRVSVLLLCAVQELYRELSILKNRL